MSRPKYVSIDIETTGLDVQKSQVLQVGMVYDDGEKPIERLERTSFIIRYDYISYGEPFALQLNTDLLKRQRDGLYIDLARTEFKHFLSSCMSTGVKRLTAAGKNYAGFDAPILKNNGFDTRLISHRVIDPGTLYLPDFGYVPTLDEINHLNGRDKVAHDALADALDVVAAIRAKTWVLGISG